MIEGLEKAIEIIQEEKKFAKMANQVMYLGMEQVENLIKREIKELKNLEYITNNLGRE